MQTLPYSMVRRLEDCFVYYNDKILKTFYGEGYFCPSTTTTKACKNSIQFVGFYLRPHR